MKDREIFERTTPESWVVLGIKLRPFSLGHLLLLYRFQSVFVGFEPNPNPFTDLALAVMICARTYEDALDWFGDPARDEELAKWRDDLHGITPDRPNGRPIELSQKISIFESYLKSNDLRFEKDKDYIAAEDSRTVNIPFVHSVRVKLQSRMHFSDSEILNRSWALCLLDYYILADMDGIIALTDKDATKKAIEESQAAGDKLAELLKSGKVSL